jgi:hypothetical protein
MHVLEEGKGILGRRKKNKIMEMRTARVVLWGIFGHSLLLMIGQLKEKWQLVNFRRESVTLYLLPLMW